MLYGIKLNGVKTGCALTCDQAVALVKKQRAKGNECVLYGLHEKVKITIGSHPHR